MSAGQEETVTKIEEGKRYRYTVEGTAHQSLLRERLVLDLGRGYVLPSAFVDGTGPGVLELLPDPLPTAPGSVIRNSTVTLVRTTAPGKPWMNVNGAQVGACYSDEEMEGAQVVFDAGTVVQA